MARKGGDIDLLTTVVVGHVLADCKETPCVKGLASDYVSPQFFFRRS